MLDFDAVDAAKELVSLVESLLVLECLENDLVEFELEEHEIRIELGVLALVSE